MGIKKSEISNMDTLSQSENEFELLFCTMEKLSGNSDQDILEIFKRCVGNIQDVSLKLLNSSNISKYGANLVKLLQSCAKIGPKITIAHLQSKIVHISSESLKILRRLSAHLTFKTVFTVELLHQKIATMCTSMADFDACLAVLHDTINLLRETKYLDVRDSNDLAASFTIRLDRSKPIYEKLVAAIAYCYYNACRAYVEVEAFDQALLIAMNNLPASIRLLEDIDSAKASQYVKSSIALLFQHAPALLEKKSKLKVAYEFRKQGLQFMVDFGAVDGVENQENTGPAVSSTFVNRIISVTSQYLKFLEKSSMQDQMDQVASYLKSGWSSLLCLSFPMRMPKNEQDNDAIVQYMLHYCNTLAHCSKNASYIDEILQCMKALQEPSKVNRYVPRTVIMLQLILAIHNMHGDHSLPASVASHFHLLPKSDTLSSLARKLEYCEGVKRESEIKQIVKQTEKLCRLEPSDRVNELLFVIATILAPLLRGSTLMASSLRNRALELDPRLPQSRQSLILALEITADKQDTHDKLLIVAYNHGVKLFNVKEFEIAILWLELAQGFVALESRLRTMKLLAASYFQTNQFEKARKVFLSIIELDTESSIDFAGLCSCNLSIYKRGGALIFGWEKLVVGGQSSKRIKELLRKEIDEIENVCTRDGHRELTFELQDCLIQVAKASEIDECASVEELRLRCMRALGQSSDFEIALDHSPCAELPHEEQILFDLWQATITTDLSVICRIPNEVTGDSFSTRHLDDMKFIAEWLESQNHTEEALKLLHFVWDQTKDAAVAEQIALLAESYFGEAAMLRSMLSQDVQHCHIDLLRAQYVEYATAKIDTPSLNQYETEFPHISGKIAFSRAVFEWKHGRFYDALNTALRSLPLILNGFHSESSTYRRTKLLAGCLSLIGILFQQFGDPRSSRYYFEQGKSLCEKQGNKLLCWDFDTAIASLNLECEKFDRIDTTIPAGLTVRHHLEMLILHAHLLLAKGESDSAVTCVEQAKGMIKKGLRQTIQFLDFPDAHDSVESSHFACVRHRLTLLEAQACKSLDKYDMLKEVSTSDAFDLVDRARLHIARNHIMDHAYDEAENYLLQVMESGRNRGIVTLNRLVFRFYAYCVGLYNPPLASFLTNSSCALSNSIWTKRVHGEVDFLHETWSMDIEKGFQRHSTLRQSMLPDSWVVCTLALTEDPNIMLVCRETRNSTPVHIGVPLKCCPKRTLEEFHDIIAETEKTTKGLTAEHANSWSKAQKRDWWCKRESLDRELKDFLAEFEGMWIGPLKILFSPPVLANGRAKNTIAGNLKYFTALSKQYPRLQMPILELFYENYYQWSEDELFDAFGALHPDIPESDIRLIFSKCSGTRTCGKSQDFSNLKVAELKAELTRRNLPTNGLKKDLLQRLEQNCQESTTDDVSVHVEESSIILIVSEQLQAIPLESLPSLRKRNVSRMPNFVAIFDRLGQTASQTSTNGAFMVDPKGDLINTRETLAPFLKRVSASCGWVGMAGSHNRDEQTSFWMQNLQDRDLMLYCGHGNAEDLFSREKLAALPQCATTLLMGCSSGKHENQGLFEPTTIVTSYMIAGSKAVVANLWDVTDKDIDRLTLALLESFVFDGKTLVASLQRSRDECKLPYLVGAATICYGLPVNKANMYYPDKN